jgi:PAS domain S-box-containing protein
MKGTIIAVNPAIEKMTGYSQSELVGASVRDIAQRVVSPDHLEEAAKSLEMILGGKAPPPLAVSILSKDRRKIPVILAASFIKTRRGKPRAIVATIKDLSDLQSCGSPANRSLWELALERHQQRVILVRRSVPDLWTPTAGVWGHVRCLSGRSSPRGSSGRPGGGQQGPVGSCRPIQH